MVPTLLAFSDIIKARKTKRNATGAVLSILKCSPPLANQVPSISLARPAYKVDSRVRMPSSRWCSMPTSASTPTTSVSHMSSSPTRSRASTEFKSFSLRDGGNDFGDLYFRDLIIQRTMGENTDIDWQAGHTAVLYINGEYMGMLNIRERSNEDNIESNYGIEDMDMVEISHEKVNNVDQFIEEFKGSEDTTFYNGFKRFYSQKRHTLAEYEQWLDVSEYLNICSDESLLWQ